ncbi:DUF581 family protein, putative (DUF581) [Tasmannia lanceolata]|uniref:DUF581 family protein, putative (DUF581) n=1 Tax=Tasmannia lanceolata TaxID=3420 RepID=UPI004062BAAE
MVGLSILLEAQKNLNQNPQIISKITMLRPLPSNSSPPLRAISFLDACFLCKKRLSPGKDIYMYRGDRAFCSVDCRCRQIFMDEENVSREKKCSVSASSSRHRKGNRNKAGGLFVY